MIDPQLPREQAGFRRGRSTADQIKLLTQDIYDRFQTNGVVLLDPNAAYDTVWLRGLNLKLPKTVPDNSNSDAQQNRLRRLKNGAPQGSVLAPLLFNIYIHDRPETTSNKHGFADDLAILLGRRTWEAVEEELKVDMNILAAYLKRRRLQPSGFPPQSQRIQP